MAVSLRFTVLDMDRLQQKRSARKLLVQSKRKDKLISAYIQAKHPEIYAEATAFYQNLDALYPTKRDLCKTVEFLRITTGASNYHSYYYQRKLEKKQSEKKAAETTTPEMVLQIPLLTQETVQAQTTLDIPGAADVITEVQQDHALRDVFKEMTTHETVQREDPSCQSLVQDQNEAEKLQIETTSYQSLVQELLNDPMLQDAFEDIELNDPSPLENELINMGM